MTTLRLTLLAPAILMPLAGSVFADDSPAGAERLRISGLFAGTAGQLGTDLAFGGSIGYRFAPRLSVEAEVTSVPEARSGDALLATANLRREFVSEKERVRPFLSGGFGIARTETRTRVPVPFLDFRDPITRPPANLGELLPLLSFQPRSRRHNETDLAVTLGAGMGVRLFGSLFLDLDARYYRLMDPGRSVGRFGSGLSYRF